MAWAAEWEKEGEKVDWQKLMPPRGFRVLPRRRVVERTLAWICHNQRMSLGITRGCARAAKHSRICCHEATHGEAVGSRLRLFHTVSFSAIQ
jgi:hypothetical protein